MITRSEVENFLDRPNGGIEVELFIAVVELWFAVALTVTAQTMWNMTTLREFYWVVPHYVMALPWLISSAATIGGLMLYRWGNKWASPIRLIGAHVSFVVWFVMFFTGLFASNGALGTLSFYFFSMIWQIRIMVSAKRRVRGFRFRGG